MKLSERIYTLRKQKGMTQDELASYCQVSRQAVSKWENQESKPDIESIINLSELFDMGVDEFLGISHKSKKKLLPTYICIVAVFVVGIIIGLLIDNQSQMDNQLQSVAIDIVDTKITHISTGLYHIELTVNEDCQNRLELIITADDVDYIKNIDLTYNSQKMCYETDLILSKNTSYDIKLVVNEDKQIYLYKNVVIEEYGISYESIND